MLIKLSLNLCIDDFLFKIQGMSNNILTIDEIKHLFLDEWILLNVVGDTTTKNDTGIVLFHSKDYLELCYKGSEIAPDKLTKIFYTGEQKQHRQFIRKRVLYQSKKEFDYH